MKRRKYDLHKICGDDFACGYNRWLHGVYMSCGIFTLLLCLLQLAS